MSSTFASDTRAKSSRSQSFKIDVKVDGYAALQAKLNGLNKALKNNAKVGMIIAARSYKRRLKQDIKSGGSRYGFPVNKGEYGDKKSSAGKPDSLFSLTGAYYRSIIVHWTKRNNVAVGVDNKAIAPYLPGFGNKKNRRVSWYINIVEKKYPLQKLSFRAWGGRKKIKQIMDRTNKIGIHVYMKQGIITNINYR